MTDKQKAKEYPIDTSELKKGDYISQEQLESITKLPAGSSRFAFKVLAIKNYIQKSLAKRGDLVTCAIRRNGIAILTDAEAAVYNVKFAFSGARRIRKGRVRHSVIDLSKLTEAERAEWDKNARRLASMHEGIKPNHVGVKPHKRIT